MSVHQDSALDIAAARHECQQLRQLLSKSVKSCYRPGLCTIKRALECSGPGLVSCADAPLRRDDEGEPARHAADLCVRGHKYRFGYGVVLDLEKAFHYYAEAARLGDAEGLACAGETQGQERKRFPLADLDS